MSKALAILGDWNAEPADRGRYSPRWIAHAAGLRIHSTGPGRHGDIDYAMADCHVAHAARHEPPAGATRSDHDVVTFVAYNPDNGNDQLTLASWNVRYGRDPQLVRSQVRRVLEFTGADVLALQEAADYHPELRQLAEATGYRMLAYSGRGKAHNVLLARAELATHRPKLVQLSPLGWRLADGTGSHAALHATSWTVEWLRVVDVHMPPSVNWRRGGLIYGPVRRVAAYAAGAGRLVRWARTNRRHRRP